MRPYLDELWGNPSSLYIEGRQAREAVDRARVQVASSARSRAGRNRLHRQRHRGRQHGPARRAAGRRASRCHLITSAIEHPAILACCRQLERLGVTVTELPVSSDGLVDPADLQAAIRPETRLVSVMAANNVIGTIQPIAELAEIAHGRGVLFHTDARAGRRQDAV